MEIIKWANGQGYTIGLDLLELAELETAIQKASRSGHGETGHIEIEVERGHRKDG